MVEKKVVKETKTKETNLDEQYIIQFTRNFDTENNDLISLSVKYNKELQKLLETVIVKNELAKVKFEEYKGTNKKVDLERYKVKSWLLNSLSGEYKELLFLKPLIDAGETTIKCDNLNVLNSIASDMRENIIKASNFILKNNGYKTTIKIKVDKE